MNDQIILTQDQLSFLSSHWAPLKFETDFNFNYENQILNGVLALTKGEIEIIKNSKLVDVIGPGVIIGFLSMKNNKKMKYQMRIKAGSSVVLVGRSGLGDLDGLIGNNVETKK